MNIKTLAAFGLMVFCLLFVIVSNPLFEDDMIPYLVNIREALGMKKPAPLEPPAEVAPTVVPKTPMVLPSAQIIHRTPAPAKKQASTPSLDNLDTSALMPMKKATPKFKSALGTSRLQPDTRLDMTPKR